MSIYQCSLCPKEFANIKGFTWHIINVHESPLEDYYNRFIQQTKPECEICGNKTKFNSIPKGYSKTCSPKCAGLLQWKNSDERREQNRKRFLENNPTVPGVRKGCKNKNSYPVTEKVLARYKDNPPPSWEGKKHSKQTLNKMSESRLNKISTGEIKIMPSMKGKFTPKHPKKYKGNPTNIIYRSSWELHFMLYLDSNSEVVQWSSEEIVIPYISPLDKRRHSYYVDFWIKLSNGKEKLIEIKPYNSCIEPSKPTDKRKARGYYKDVSTYLVNQAKWNSAKEYCKDRKMEFVVLTERELYHK